MTFISEVKTQYANNLSLAHNDPDLVMAIALQNFQEVLFANVDYRMKKWHKKLRIKRAVLTARLIIKDFQIELDKL